MQVNTGEEDQKAGITPAEADFFIATARATYGFEIEGLMCIPPAEEPCRPAHLALLAKIAARNGLARLSMGDERRLRDRGMLAQTSVRSGISACSVRGVQV